MSMQVDVVSAEQSLLSAEATEVYARTIEGEIGILPGHQPALLALDIGVLRVRTVEGEEERVAVHNGFLYFRANELVVLADLAELASEVDTGRAEQRLRQLKDRTDAEVDPDVKASIRKQQIRLAAATG